MNNRMMKEKSTPREMTLGKTKERQDRKETERKKRKKKECITSVRPSEEHAEYGVRERSQDQTRTSRSIVLVQSGP